ncbi:TusE/DsrC/DsvC family sulfur relay protein [Thioalkalicoccus limnaeus]|uniref:TusE/DsrC/DsvC family sulfur relay protein n=1 Tax=Thioalkalicoccus limnaeus TaxID=120681 RepID=A0ABV4BH94_9GAMM
MIAVTVSMKVTQEPLKRTPVVLRFDEDGRETAPVLTDRLGTATFDLPPTSGQVLVSGIPRYDGRLDGEIRIELWSITQSEQGSHCHPGTFPSGSNAYPSMTTRPVKVNDHEVLTDSEGYLVDPADWSEAFARALAVEEGLALQSEHWEVVRFLRGYYAQQGTQATVRDMIRHFSRVWGADKGSSRYLHKLFPRGGPQKQGNRLAGLLRTKGEH